MWFAQNSLPLWLKWQLSMYHRRSELRCDLLKIHYLCGWNDNQVFKKREKCLVVICSKFITFVVEMTTDCLKPISESLLWFAQNSLPLWLKWQHRFIGRDKPGGCDLLKIHYLCGWNDNESILSMAIEGVVICSKFITFVVEMTTSNGKRLIHKALWFAQNSLPLWLKWQPKLAWGTVSKCCDLLKIHYLCGWNDNISFTFDCVSDRYMSY